MRTGRSWTRASKTIGTRWACADTLAAVAEGLNAHNVHGPKGQRWTEELLEAELERVAR